MTARYPGGLLVLLLISACAGPAALHPPPQDGSVPVHHNSMLPGNARFQDGLLVADNGMTLYRFDQDQPGSGNSHCHAACAVAWPPYLAAPLAQPPAEFDIITRQDGSRQWAYKGWPLYFWHLDSHPGDSGGDNIGMAWHVIHP